MIGAHVYHFTLLAYDFFLFCRISNVQLKIKRMSENDFLFIDSTVNTIGPIELCIKSTGITATLTDAPHTGTTRTTNTFRVTDMIGMKVWECLLHCWC